jgi:hypothetical protein
MVKKIKENSKTKILKSLMGTDVGGYMQLKYYILMYEKGKMRPVEIITEMGGRGDKGE